MSRVYELLGRLIWFSAGWLAMIYLRRTNRVYSIVMIDQPVRQVLLVKNWLGDGNWRLPGGGMHSKETETQALERELREELGISLPQTRDKLTEFESNGGVKSSVYTVRVKSLDHKRRITEITAAEWFDLNQLPENIDEDILPILKAV